MFLKQPSELDRIQEIALTNVAIDPMALAEARLLTFPHRNEVVLALMPKRVRQPDG